MKENFPNLVKGINMKVQEARRVLNKMDAKRSTPRHVIIKTPKVEDKERILTAAREKQLVTYRGVPVRLSADFSKKLCSQKGLARSVKSEKQGPTSKITLSGQTIV